MNSHFLCVLWRVCFTKRLQVHRNLMFRYCSIISLRSVSLMACIAFIVACECVWHTIHLFLLDRVLISFVAKKNLPASYFFSSCVPILSLHFMLLHHRRAIVFFISFFFLLLLRLKRNPSNISSVCTMLLSINCQWCRIRCVV